jgi:hypothetical protein
MLGSIGLTYGIGVLIYSLRTGLSGTTGYKSGQAVAVIVALAVIYFSARTIIRDIREGAHRDPSN